MENMLWLRNPGSLWASGWKKVKGDLEERKRKLKKIRETEDYILRL